MLSISTSHFLIYITHQYKQVYFRIEWKSLKLSQFLKVAIKRWCQTIDQYRCFHLFQRYLKNWFVLLLLIILRVTIYFMKEKKYLISCPWLCVNRITDSIDNGNLSAGIFLNLSKAFDTVSHDNLLDKLSYYGLSSESLRRFESYLANRQQYVCVDYSNSDLKSITLGIPQGSTLGPILFLISLNDAEFVAKEIYFLIYANDMNLLYRHKKNIENLWSIE